MRKNTNKGYTLVELMLTLLIFSVIMVSIIAVMRTAVVSYKDGLTETTVQENAQIAVNQLSNILIDASDFSTSNPSGVGVAASNPWSFTHPTYHSITLSYNPVAGTDGVLRGDLIMNGEMIAQNVTDFRIKDLYKTADPASNPVDNAAVITLSVDDGHGGHKYTVDKVVFFRNNVENSDNMMYDVSGATGGESEVVVTGGTKCEVNRYAEVDITKKYGIVKVDAMDTTTGVNYEFVDGQLTASATPGTTKGIRIAARGSLLTDYTKPIEAKDPTESTCNKVVGYDSSNNKIELVLYTKPVKIDSSIGVIEIRADQSVNNGYHTTVPVEGIDIYNGIAKGKINVKCKQTLKIGTESCDVSYNVSNASSAAIGNWSDGIRLQFSDGMKNAGYGDRLLIGMVGDVNSHGLTITTANDAAKNMVNIGNTSNVKKELSFDLTIQEVNPGGSTVDRYNKVHKFDLIYTGEGLETVNS